MHLVFMIDTFGGRELGRNSFMFLSSNIYQVSGKIALPVKKAANIFSGLCSVQTYKYRGASKKCKNIFNW